jgi:hypothetical protein
MEYILQLFAKVKVYLMKLITTTTYPHTVLLSPATCSVLQQLLIIHTSPSSSLNFFFLPFLRRGKTSEWRGRSSISKYTTVKNNVLRRHSVGLLEQNT